MDFLDVILTIVYFGICLGIGYAIKNGNKSNPLYKKWFIKGLVAKLLGCIGFCMVYTFYYNYGGDTKGYFQDATNVIQSLQYRIDVFAQVFFRQYDNVSADTLNVIGNLLYQARTEYITVNLSVPFVILGLGSYFSASLLIATFSYWGVWRLFQLFVEKYPAIEKQMAFSVLFIPSVAFWGSGISKDTFILCFLGLFLYHAKKLFSSNLFKPSHLLIFGISGYLAYSIKSYVIISIIPALLLWRTMYLRDLIKNRIARAIVLPVFGVVGLLIVIWSISLLGKYNEEYNIDNILFTAQSMQGWHYVVGQNTAAEHGRGSSYSLGEYDPTPSGIARMFPAAVNVTFFRPYPWEVNGVAMLAQAIESMFFLLFSVLLFFRVGPLKMYKIVSNDSFLLMCLVFAIFFGFAVGFSAYNFGALSRYKIPAMPFFLSTLFIIRFKSGMIHQSKYKKFK